MNARLAAATITILFAVGMPATGGEVPRWTGSREVSRRIAGGGIMGFGGAMIPGGNDTVVLTGIPTLSLVALLTYAALLLGIAAVLVVMRAAGAEFPVVECGGDACTSR